MTDIPLETGSAIETYIKDLKNQVKAGLGQDAILGGNMEIEIATTLEKDTSGKFNISVLKFGAGVSQQEVHKLKIPITLLSDAAKAEIEALKVEAEARKAHAEFEKSMAINRRDDYDKAINSKKEGNKLT